MEEITRMHFSKRRNVIENADVLIGTGSYMHHRVIPRYRGLYFLLMALLLSSCATVLTKRNYNVRITATPENAKMLINDRIYQLPALVKLKRSKQDLKLKLLTDSMVKEQVVKPTLNPWFLFGNLIGMQVAPAGYLIDFTNQKRFSYGKNLHFNLYDTATVMRLGVVKSWYDFKKKKFNEQKGAVRLGLSFPYINQFYQLPQGETRKNNAGFLGIAIGADYFHKSNQFIGIRVGGIMDFPMPFPTAIDYGSTHEMMNAVYGELSNNHVWNRLSIGYGLQYQRMEWSRYHGKLDTAAYKMPELSKTQHTIGATLHSYFQWTKLLYTGVDYRPSFIIAAPKTALIYQHTLSVDVVLKMSVVKRKRRAL